MVFDDFAIAAGSTISTITTLDSFSLPICHDRLSIRGNGNDRSYQHVIETDKLFLANCLEGTMQLDKPLRTLPKYLTQDELHRFFNAIDSLRDRARFAVIYHSSLQVDEATMLTIEDLNLKHRRLRVRRLKNGVAFSDQRRFA
jgi:integrase